MMSACPRSMIAAHSPIACALEAHAETWVRFGPFSPNCIETWAEPAFAMSIGTRNGDSRLGPRFSMSRTCSTSVSSPPTAGRDRDADALGLFRHVHLAMVRACDAAATANCANRSVRRASFRSMYFVGSKSFTSPAICDS